MLEIKLNGYKRDANEFFIPELEAIKYEFEKSVASPEFTDMEYHIKWEFLIAHRYVNLYVLMYGIRAANKELAAIFNKHYRVRLPNGQYVLASQYKKNL